MIFGISFLIRYMFMFTIELNEITVNVEIEILIFHRSFCLFLRLLQTRYILYLSYYKVFRKVSSKKSVIMLLLQLGI